MFWSEIGKLHTVAERGVMMDAFGRQYMNLPKGPVEEEGAVPRLLRKYPNLCGDLSDGTAYNAIARNEHYGPRFLSEFEDRLYFGTDMCFPTMEVKLDKLLLHWRKTGKISETTFRKIAYKTRKSCWGCNTCVNKPLSLVIRQMTGRAMLAQRPARTTVGEGLDPPSTWQVGTMYRSFVQTYTAGQWLPPGEAIGVNCLRQLWFCCGKTTGRVKTRGVD